jgi:hypothetical protein
MFTRNSTMLTYVPRIEPGDGFSGATAQPSAQGSSGQAGYTSTAIARWNVVPWQTFAGVFYVGVVAFHMAGMSHVEFSVNGGEWAAARAMAWNPFTRTFEYCCRLDAADFDAYGQIEVRAVAYPLVGVPRVLGGTVGTTSLATGNHSMWLNADHNGSVLAARPVRWVNKTSGNDANDGLTSGTAKATIINAAKNIQTVSGNCDNAIIYLSEEDHIMLDGTVGDNKPLCEDGWLWVRGAPGTNPANVRIIGATGGARYVGFSRAKFSDLRITVPLGTTGANQPAAIWLAGGSMGGETQIDAVNTVGTFGSGWTGGKYMTDCTQNMIHSGPTGVNLHRNVTFEDIGSDPWTSCMCIINSTANRVDPREDLYGAQGVHADTLAFGGDCENIVVYGVRITNYVAISWGNSSADIIGIAVVNVLWDGTGGRITVGEGVFEHITGVCEWKNATTTYFTNVSIKNCIFQSMTFAVGIVQTNVELDNNRFIDGDTFGTNATTGSAGFNGAEDFRPGAASTCRNLVAAPLTPADAANNQWQRPDAIGALRQV